MGETANITKLPPFGDLLNSGIQTLKNLSGRSSISQNLFFREFDKVSQLSDDQKSISYLSQFDIQNEYEEGTPCYEPLTNLILMCLSAMGVIKENCFSLQPNIGKEFASLITFDEKVTIKNLVRLDPLGKIFFWLANENFSQYLMKGIPNNDYIANLKRFDEKSFQDLKKVNQMAYGKRGDPLINYFINETTRRTSLFMNNYQDAMVSDGNVKVTPDMILTQLDNLTPLQFEWFCLKLVEPLRNYRIVCLARTERPACPAHHLFESFNNGHGFPSRLFLITQAVIAFIIFWYWDTCWAILTSIGSR